LYQDLVLQVSDLTGRVLLERIVRADEKEIIIPVTGWKTGIYWFTLRYNEKVMAIEKVVIN